MARTFNKIAVIAVDAAPTRRGEINAAKAEIKRTIMARYGGDLIGPALVGVEVSDDDAARWLAGASIEELLA